MRKTIFYTFVLAGVGVPLLFTPFLFSSFELGKAVLFRLAVLFILLLLGIVVVGKSKFEWIKIERKFWVFLGLFVLSNVLACLFSIAPQLSFWGSYERQQGLFQFLHYVLFFLVFVSFFDRKKIEVFFQWLCFGAFAISLIAILQYYFGFLLSFWDVSILINRFAIGTLGQPNFLASYLLMLVPFYILRICENKNWVRYVWMIGLIVVLMAMILTLSRGAFVGLGGIMLFMGIFYRRKLIFVIVLFFFVLLVANLGSGYSFIKNNQALDRFRFQGEALRSVETRLQLWPATVKMIVEKPVFGYGQESFKEAFQKFAPAKLLYLEDIHKKSDRAHSEVLDVSVTTGLVGLVAYLLFLFVVFDLAIRRRKDIFVLAAASSVFALFVNNFFEFSVTVNYLLWWILVGVIVVLGGKKYSVEIINLKSAWKKIVSMILIIIFVGFGVITNVKHLIADYYYDKGNLYASGLFYFKAAEWMEKATAMNPNEVYYDLRAGELALIGARNMTEDFYRDILLGFAERFINRARNLIGENSTDVLKLRAEFMILLNSPDLAIGLLERAHEQAPIDTKVILDLAEAYLLNDDYSGALKIYREFLSLMPHWYKAFEMEQASNRDNFLFRIFFKSNALFTDVLRKIAFVAERAGLSEEAQEYQLYAEKIDEVMDSY